MHKILTVTGYKPFEINIMNPNDPKIKFIKSALRKNLISHIENGLEWVLLSGQMGVELWTCEVISELQETYDIKLGIIPPFDNQDARWPEVYQEAYQQAILEADFFQLLYEDDYKGPYQFKRRDKWLIEKSQACLVLVDEENQGSVKFFLDEAKKHSDYSIYYITPFDLEDAVQEWLENNPEVQNSD
ncbi:UPF0398 protein [Paraliobacillus quinghaiensis]|uniref:UPF0398 protein n=1 Tax=Paraliobacillus quinghaiensis TaxID=470815 RepID=A0A917WRJ2_9BACI|nr:SLOG family protein [Paraliobacillus quinghaiensis]GGM23190.1 UPF0398 protein [Paraliobacillus quinghaiensis]